MPILATMITTQGCLVLDKIELPEEPLCPPSIEATGDAQFPINQIAKIDLDMLLQDSVSELVFETVIRDCNTSQVLIFQAILDDQPPVSEVRPFHSGTIAPSGRDPHGIQLPLERLTDEAGRCHQVELLVSGAFKNFGREPATPGDIGTATWWLEVVDASNPTVDINTCP